ncbi:MBL fold metallo-hydrolase [Elusimicrobiota bacterium]
MKITVWGARGSIPVSGSQYLRYGGDTTCVELETRSRELIIMDAGSGIRPLGNKVLAEKRRSAHLLLSHAHWDHILGFPFFKPLYLKDTTIYLHGCTIAQESIKHLLGETMRAPFFPVDLNKVAANLVYDDRCPDEFTVAGLCVQRIPLSHPNKGYGFRLTEEDKSLAFFPDNEPLFSHPDGKDFKDYVEFLKGVDVLIHDAEYLPEEYERFAKGWGHSVSLDTVRLALDAEVKHLILWHLNQDRDDDAVGAMLADARKAVKAAGSDMVVDMARTGLSIEVGALK